VTALVSALATIMLLARKTVNPRAAKKRVIDCVEFLIAASSSSDYDTP
jgi:hypothetical protein